jgi:hypothetical protein
VRVLGGGVWWVGRGRIIRFEACVVVRDSFRLLLACSFSLSLWLKVVLV